jgi:hypothetical protein
VVHTDPYQHALSLAGREKEKTKKKEKATPEGVIMGALAP